MRRGLWWSIRVAAWSARRHPGTTAVSLATYTALGWIVAAAALDDAGPRALAAALGTAVVLLGALYVVSIRRATRGAVLAIGTIDTPRLRLRAMRPGDEPAVRATIDDEVVAANGWLPDAADAWIGPHPTLALFPPPHDWLVTERDTGAVLGVMSAQPRPGGPLELGWWVGPTARGRGVATEAVAATLAALHAHGEAVVRIGTTDDNHAVHRILDTVGAVRVADAPHTLPNGAHVTSRWYEHRA